MMVRGFDRDFSLYSVNREDAYGNLESEEMLNRRINGELEALWPMIQINLRGKATEEYLKDILFGKNGSAKERISQGIMGETEKNYPINSMPGISSHEIFPEWIGFVMDGIKLERILEGGIDWSIHARRRYSMEELTATIVTSKWDTRVLGEISRSFKVAYYSGIFTVNILYCNDYGITWIPFYMNRRL